MKPLGIVLLLTPALAMAAPDAVNSELFTLEHGDQPGFSGIRRTFTFDFNGQQYDKYVDPDRMGPLVPGQEYRQDQSAFNALESMPPMETITVASPDGKTYRHDAWFTRDEKGRITGGKIAFDTGASCMAPVDIASLADKKDLQPYERAYLEDVAKNKDRYAMPGLLAVAGADVKTQQAENKGFDPTGGYRGGDRSAASAGSSLPSSGPAADDASPSGFDVGLLTATLGGMDDDAGARLDGAPERGSSGKAQGRTMGWSHEKALESRGGLITLDRDATRAIGNLQRAAGILSGSSAGGADDGVTAPAGLHVERNDRP